MSVEFFPEKALHYSPKLHHILHKKETHVSPGLQSGVCSHVKNTWVLEWLGDSQRESGRFARSNSRESLRKNSLIFRTFERFARIGWESAKASHMMMFALLTPEIRGWKMAQMLQNGLSTDEREHPFV